MQTVTPQTSSERAFWRYWLGGLLLLMVMAAINPLLANPVAPWAIIDHQMAGSAARVDAIQNAWAADGKLALARFSIAVDLLFIAIYSWGAFLGGRMMRQEALPVLRRLGSVIIIAAALYPFLDYAETICQFVQIMTFKGSDILAQIAATARPIKSVDFLVTFVGLLTALALRRMARRNA
jgi:hypothetical protein